MILMIQRYNFGLIILDNPNVLTHLLGPVNLHHLNKTYNTIRIISEVYLNGFDSLW